MKLNLVMPLLEVKNLTVYYETLRGYVHSVEDVNLVLERGKTLGLAGESGCGKTSVALAILKLLPENARVLRGEVLLEDENLLELDDERFRREVRWKKLSVIFQGAMNALHPTHKIGEQIAESITLHEEISKGEALNTTGKLLDLVGVKAERIDRYPHELSGGMKQRVMIAMALACNPLLVIADEPTTALDVIVQAQVLQVLEQLKKRLDLSMIEISHDLSLISETCDDVAIMYAGEIVEYGGVTSVYVSPLHPYSERLINAFPSVRGPKKEIIKIGGFPPNLLNPPKGCRFNPRCLYAQEICTKKKPSLKEVEHKHLVACHLL